MLHIIYYYNYYILKHSINLVHVCVGNFEMYYIIHFIYKFISITMSICNKSIDRYCHRFYLFCAGVNTNCKQPM